MNCRGLLLLETVWLSTSVLAFAAEPTAPPVISPAQIEADWLRQDEVRVRQAPASPNSRKITCADDATGGCDGNKTGKWGFHTENEDNPWWQVDFGAEQTLDRLEIYNRCDETAGRASRLIVLLSTDGKQFDKAYQHDGKPFYGFTDKKPLVVKLAGAKARLVRLQLPGKSYFHLDEVEVYTADGHDNVARRKPATQSSVSQWSVSHKKTPDTLDMRTREYPIELAIERGLKLAENLAAAGVDVAHDAKELADLGERARSLTPDAPDAERPQSVRPLARQQLYFDVRQTVRRLALKNPLLDFDSLLFCKSAPGQFPHMSDQFYGWWSRPGGGIFILEDFKSNTPRLRCLTPDFAPGSFLRPDLSYDGRRVLFAYAKHYKHVPELPNKVNKANLPEDAFYHIYEIDLETRLKGSGPCFRATAAREDGASWPKNGPDPVDGSGLRQLTRGKYDDFDARYLPSGDICFLSTRKGQFLQCAAANTMQTTTADLPDSYVRCGGGDSRPVPVFTLHAMGSDGGNLRPISAFENFEWTPAVAADGRILYTRWDYIDRFNGHFFSLWSTNPDGGNPQLVYGNYTVRPQVVAEAMPIPGSTKLAMIAGAHHSNLGGSLVLCDRTRGTEEAAPLTRLTPEVPYPETEANGPCYYLNPWPLSEDHFLVSFSDRPLPPHCRVDDSERNPVNATGLYLYDAFGNLNLLYRDPEISSGNPIPVRPRPKPPAYADTVDRTGPQEGRFLVQDVYEGLGGVPRGSIKRLRVVAVPPKVQPYMNNPVLGISKEDPGKFVLGTVPVEADGSAHFYVPSGVSVLFQALDADGLAVQTMRSLTYVQPGQTLGCVGCHEHRDVAPGVAQRGEEAEGRGETVVRNAGSPRPRVREGKGNLGHEDKGRSPLVHVGEGLGERGGGSVKDSAPRPSGPPLVAMREPSKLTLGPDGSWPLKFSELVQPVLDRQCVSCHSPMGSDPAATKFDLSPAKSYDNLLRFGNKDIEKLAIEKDRSYVGDCVARRSKLWALLTAGSEQTRRHGDAETRGGGGERAEGGGEIVVRKGVGDTGSPRPLVEEATANVEFNEKPRPPLPHVGEGLGVRVGGAAHFGVSLTATDRERLATWLDTYAHRVGHYSDEQEAQLRKAKRDWSEMLSDN